MNELKYLHEKTHFAVKGMLPLYNLEDDIE